MNWQKTRMKLISLGISESSMPEVWQTEIDLSWANLSGDNLSVTNLSWAVLSGANLSWANLSWAVLSGANLSGANLSWAVLSGANLSWANLSGANLSGANLSGDNLSGANLSGTNLSGTNLSGANLSGAVLPHPGFDSIPEPELAKRILVHIDEDQDSLNMSEWHTCDMRHCAWGWAVVENGDAGRTLESTLGIQSAGAMLFPAFAPFVTESNERAIEELKRIAEGK